MLFHPIKCLSLIVALCLSGCSYHYASQSLNSITRGLELSPKFQMHRMRLVTVLPQDRMCMSPVGVEDEEFQQTLRENMLRSLQQRFTQVQVLPLIERDASALRSARNQGCDLLMYPEVIRREDKIWSVAEWDEFNNTWGDLGMDRLQMSLTVWDVNSRQVIDKAVVSSRSAWLDLGDSNSEDLVAESIEHYLQLLVAVQ